MLFLFTQLDPPTVAGLLLGLLAGIAAHEFSHAFVADQLGDHRPRALGRVTLNPLRHLDPLGTALLLLIGIGWKPVPVAIEALRPGRIGMAYVAGAGPIANVVVALLLAPLRSEGLDLAGLEVSAAHEFLLAAVHVNLLLALLNLIPIPPLDGFAVLTAVVTPLGVRDSPLPELRGRPPSDPAHPAQQPIERHPGPGPSLGAALCGV